MNNNCRIFGNYQASMGNHQLPIINCQLKGGAAVRFVGATRWVPTRRQAARRPGVPKARDPAESQTQGASPSRGNARGAASRLLRHLYFKAADPKEHPVCHQRTVNGGLKSVSMSIKARAGTDVTLQGVNPWE